MVTKFAVKMEHGLQRDQLIILKNIYQSGRELKERGLFLHVKLIVLCGRVINNLTQTDKGE
jgi:hypothetical protein